MESLKTKQLFEAASTGRVDSLKTLLDEDLLILDRISIDYDISDTPLHVAAMLGHTDFVKEIIRLRPQLINDSKSWQKSSPLHLASAKGHVDIVRALLAANRQLGLVLDKNGLAPAHLAAINGQVEVLKTLLQAEPGAARLVGYKGDNILHLCVKYCQLEALKLAVNTIGGPDELLNAKDADGNTLLHLAVAEKQVEVVDFLLSLSEVVEVNATNSNGMTAVDVLIRSRRDLRDSEIEKSLRKAGALETEGVPPVDQVLLTTRPDSYINLQINDWDKLVKEQWVDSKRNALMVVASLIATMAFQVGVNPPSGVWQESSPKLDSQGNPWNSSLVYNAGESIFAYNDKGGYIAFHAINTIGFTASLSIILLLMSGLPLRKRFFMWFLMVITWVSILAVAVVYFAAVLTITPEKVAFENSFVYIIGGYMLVWSVLMLLLLLSHTVRLIVKMIKKLIKCMCPTRTTVGAGSSGFRSNPNV